MHSFILHITLYDLISFTLMILAINAGLLSWFTKSAKRPGNRLLSSFLMVLAIWLGQILVNDCFCTKTARWDEQSMQILVLVGPLLYFFVQKTIHVNFKVSRSVWLHLIPMAAAYLASTLHLFNIVQLIFFLSVISYLQASRMLIARQYRNSDLILMDRYRLEFSWLMRLLTSNLAVCVLWFAFSALFYVYSRSHWYESGFELFCISFALVCVGTSMIAILRSTSESPPAPSMPKKLPIPTELKAKAIWVRKEMETELFYKDPDLTLASLAKSLQMTSHELSRAINTGLKKSFNEFVNEYRIREVVQRMQDPACNQFTILGLAYDAGFNSKSSFNRTFKETTGKSPLDFKKQGLKEVSSYHLSRFPGTGRINLRPPSTSGWPVVKIHPIYMFRNYLKLAWRNLTRNKTSGFVNLSGLAVGMAVAMLIGLWISDELAFDKYHQNYARIAQVMQNKTFNGTINTDATIPLPLDEAMRKNYSSDFKHIMLTAWNEKHVINAKNENFVVTGNFMSPDAPEMLTLHMVSGTQKGLTDKSSILISSSTAHALYGNGDPLNKLIRMDSKDAFKITGVFDDLPDNTTFHELGFIGSIDYYLHVPGNERSLTDWGDNSLFMYVELADNAELASVSAKIRDIKLNNLPVEDRKFKPAIFLQAMSKWHLFAEFKNGVNTGGAIQYVRLFAMIGIFVLLLACINFMNLSTARSEKRAKEVGIRKALGSLKHQLIKQFYWEASLIAILSFFVAVTLLWIGLAEFNEIAAKQIEIPWTNPLFWLTGLCFALFTGILSGSYPALYLSSFNPVKVLKGTFKAGYATILPRKILVVTQFTISILLIVSVVIVFKQIEFAKSRPVGYSRDGLVNIEVTNEDLNQHFEAVKEDLLSSGLVSSIALASSSTTGVNNSRGDLSWEGKDPFQADFFGSVRISAEYGKTLQWVFVEGHDFVPGNKADSSSVILNEAAVGYMKFQHPIGKIISVGKRALTVIGVVKNMVMESPYEPVKQGIFYLGQGPFADILIRIKPDANAHKAIEKIASVCKIYSPSVPFSYSFVDDQYAVKFNSEERVGRLAGAFAILAILISCLGLFGMASFMAEQRVKEIGVRKVLGASVFGLWQLMSKEFVMLVLISFFIAAPLGLTLMKHWLLQYSYRTQISWWIFALTAAGTLLLTLLTISYQTIKTASVNPAKSLRNE